MHPITPPFAYILEYRGPSRVYAPNDPSGFELSTQTVSQGHQVHSHTQADDSSLYSA